MVGNLTSALLANSTKTAKETTKSTKGSEAKATTAKDISQNKTESNKSQDTNIDKKLDTLLKSLTSDLVDGKRSPKAVLDLLKNSNLFKDLTKMSKGLDSLIPNLKSNPKLETQAKSLEQFSVQIKDLDGAKLKQQVQNSGIFLESKLKDISSVDIKKDMKAVLLQVQKELSTSANPKDIETLKTTEKLLTQIDLNQLQSLSANSTSLYMPFMWDMCDDAQIEFNKDDDDKFSCDIRLKLKDYGDINLSVILHDKNKIDLSFFTQTQDFKELVKDNVQDLKKKINDIGLTISSTKLLDLKKDEDIPKPNNPYGSNAKLSLDLDIKA